jgi:hypothetical protein
VPAWCAVQPQLICYGAQYVGMSSLHLLCLWPWGARGWVTHRIVPVVRVPYCTRGPWSVVRGLWSAIDLVLLHCTCKKGGHERTTYERNNKCKRGFRCFFLQTSMIKRKNSRPLSWPYPWWFVSPARPVYLVRAFISPSFILNTPISI